ncbi:MAG: class I SAM-dependent methyltransferase [Carnobacterium alterfunditum]
MDESQLSLRLSRAASYVEPGDHLADIGSDHAYLPCALASKEKVAFAIAGEIVEGPFQAAQNQVKRLGLTEKISVRLGNGLEVISKEDEITAITICGMGGLLIAAILDSGLKKAI